MARSRTAGRGPVTALDADDAFIAMLIAAMEASGHTSVAEAARAHHIIWSMRRFRRRSGSSVGRRIERMRALIETHGPVPVIRASAKRIPARLRGSAFAIAADLVLVDGRMERAEAAFLRELAADLALNRRDADRILDVMRLKNRA